MMEGVIKLHFGTGGMDGRAHQVLQPQLLDMALAFHVGALSFQLMGPTATFLTAIRGREREEVLPNVLSEQLNHDVPDLFFAARESEVQNRQRHGDRGTFAEQPTEIPPECASESGHIGQDACVAARQSGESGSKGKRRSLVGL